MAHEKRGMPPLRRRCGICGSEVHDEAHHGEERVTAVPPLRQERCERCGSDEHTTAEHPR